LDSGCGNTASFRLNLRYAAQLSTARGQCRSLLRSLNSADEQPTTSGGAVPNNADRPNRPSRPSPAPNTVGHASQRPSLVSRDAASPSEGPSPMAFASKQDHPSKRAGASNRPEAPSMQDRRNKRRAEEAERVARHKLPGLHNPDRDRQPWQPSNQVLQ
jgi:hypothetical protein